MFPQKSLEDFERDLHEKYSIDLSASSEDRIAQSWDSVGNDFHKAMERMQP